jgi:peptidase C25-like protein/flagellar hook capping protein FlgD/ASPM-SPD-2-Hydin domain-containing protein
MKIMKTIVTIVISILFIFFMANAEEIIYSDSWGDSGISIENQSNSNLEVNFSINSFVFNDILIDGEHAKSINLPGVFLPNNEGAPDLPGMGRYIALPQGATASVSIVSSRTETFSNINIAPAFRIPLDTDNGPLDYTKNMAIYNENKFYPENPVILSEQTQIRGVDVVILGITPFQYNPVSKELIVYRDLKVDISFSGGNGRFGDDRLRSRWWDPLMQDMFLNYNSLPNINYNYQNLQNSETVQDVEYLIVCPDDPAFLAWADTLKKFRTEQGILTGVVTTTEIGGNNYGTIESYINNAYATWNPAPAAVLLIGDYGTSGNTVHTGTWNGYCISDHLYADINGNDMADIIFARMTARDNNELAIMVNKVLSNERTPSTNPNYYNNPITALGWQDDRWFQICSEIVGGFWNNVLGKSTVRINALGYPANNYNTGPWSTNQNTSMIMGVFGPSGLGYIPATPQELGGFTGGNATMVNNAINSGAFMLQHRDHGSETGWGEPSYNIGSLSGLNNNDLPFVFSINCLTGKFDENGDCFAEAMHRYPQRAVGIIAATEVSYSFVNDTYVWGMFDNMWPQFMPTFGTNPASRNILPAFGNVAGKYFLQQSNWPYNTSNKEVTYYLFHHHGDAFMSVYSEMPQQLAVSHSAVLFGGQSNYTVTADMDALICLTVNGNIIGVGTGTGASIDITIPPQIPDTMMHVTITKQNYYRYEQQVPVVTASGPYTYCSKSEINDSNFNNNGIPEAGETVEMQLSFINIGVDNATNVTGIITCTDTMASLSDSAITLGIINVGDTVTVSSLNMQINAATPHLHSCVFSLELIADSAGVPGGYVWNQNIAITIRKGAEIQLVQNNLSFPNTIISYTSDLTLNIDNNGPDSLFVTDVTSDNAMYSATPTNLSIAPGMQGMLTVTFAPQDTMVYNGTITITNTDPVNFNQTFTVGGEGVMAPDISSIDSMQVYCLPSDSQVVQFTIDNIGYGELSFTTNIGTWNPGTEKLDGGDNYGHMWRDSDEPGGPTFDWIDISSTGTEIPISGDNATSGAIDIGFPFNYYGTDYSQVRVCTNGWLSFTSFLFSPANQQLPNTYAPRAMIAALWDDLDFQYNSKAYYELQNNKFIVMFEDVYCVTGEGPYTFQIILYDNSLIKMQYLSMQNLVHNYTVGIQNYAKNDGITMAYNTNYLHNDMAISIGVNSWVSVSPAFGVIHGQSSLDLDLTFQTDNFDLGDFWACLQIESNDPDETEYVIPIHMVVSMVAGIGEEEGIKIEGFHLSQNTPNPFNPTTTIMYNIEKSDQVDLVIYNMLGQKVRTLVNTQQAAKMYRVVWDGHDDHGAQVASGIYIYRLKAGENVAINKMIFMK